MFIQSDDFYIQAENPDEINSIQQKWYIDLFYGSREEDNSISVVLVSLMFVSMGQTVAFLL